MSVDQINLPSGSQLTSEIAPASVKVTQLSTPVSNRSTAIGVIEGLASFSGGGTCVIVGVGSTGAGSVSSDLCSVQPMKMEKKQRTEAIEISFPIIDEMIDASIEDCQSMGLKFGNSGGGCLRSIFP